MWWTYVESSGADYWAKWTPTISHPGFYEVQVYIPSVNATTWQARYTVVHADGQSTGVVDQAGLSNQWVSIGVYRFDQGSGYVYTTDHTGEVYQQHCHHAEGSHYEQDYCQLGVDAVRFIQHGAYLPDVRSADWWSSTLVIHNNGGATARTFVYFYNYLTGALVGTRSIVLAGNAQALLTPPLGFSYGTAIVAADQDVSAVVLQMRADNGLEGHAASAGIPVNRVSSAVHLPTIMRNYSGWYTTFRVQNVGSQASTVRSTYYTQGGSLKCSVSSSLPVPPHGNAAFNQSQQDAHVCLGDSFIGSARVQPLTGGVPLAAHLFERYMFPESLPQLYSYEGFASGSTTLYFPNLLSGAYGNWSTSFSLRNTGSSAANVTLTFRRPDGQTHCSHPLTIQANGSFAAWLPGYPYPYSQQCWFSTGWVGSATVTSDQPLVGIVNQADGSSSRAGAYSGILSGTTTGVLPYLANNAYGGWSASFSIQNLGVSATNVRIRYYRSDGTAYIDNNTYSIPAGSSRAWYLPVDGPGLPNGWLYSAVVTSDGQPIGGMVNVSNPSVYGDGFTSYSGDSR